MESSKQYAHNRPMHRQQGELPQHCKMQDVVTQPFPLTWLWRSGKAAEDIIPAIGNMDNFRRTKRPADGVGLTSVNAIEGAPRSDCVNNSTTTPVPQSEHCIPTKNTSDATPITSNRKNDTPAASTPEVSTPMTMPTKVKPLSDKQIEDREFKDGTADIPAEINELSIRIHACKCHKTSKLPMRQDLKKSLPENFFSSSRHLRPNSVLYKWFGDTRLFSKEEWLYLIGKTRAFEDKDDQDEQ